MIRNIPVMLACMVGGLGYASESQYIKLAVGRSEVRKAHSESLFLLEWLTLWNRWTLHPVVGVYRNRAQAWYAYAGLASDVAEGRYVVLRPSFCVGYYHQGHGYDLGLPMEFKTGLDLGVKFQPLECGLGLYHLSNAGLSKRNTGTELVLGYGAFHF